MYTVSLLYKAGLHVKAQKTPANGLYMYMSLIVLVASTAACFRIVTSPHRH